MRQVSSSYKFMYMCDVLLCYIRMCVCVYVCLMRVGVYVCDTQKYKNLLHICIDAHTHTCKQITQKPEDVRNTSTTEDVRNTSTAEDVRNTSTTEDVSNTSTTEDVCNTSTASAVCSCCGS